jgi:dipeptidase D
MRLPVERDPNAIGKLYVTVDLSELTGGHSGAEIHFGHLNAIKVMDRLLTASVDDLGVQLVTIDAGTTDSAIPQRAKAVIAIDPEKQTAFKESLEKVRGEIIEEDEATKQSLETSPLVKEKEKKKDKLARELPTITLSPTTGDALQIMPMTEKSTKTVLSLLADIPTGPLEVDEAYNIVKTSTNMGILETLSDAEGDFIRISSLTRSSSEDSMVQVNTVIADIANSYGAVVEPGEKKFSAWEPDFTDPLLDVARKTHKDATKKDLEVIVLHAGLESHTIKLKMAEILGDEMPKDFHIISLGPSLDGPHSESEYFDIQEAGDFFPAMRMLFKTVLQNEIDRRPQSSRRAL